MFCLLGLHTCESLPAAPRWLGPELKVLKVQRLWGAGLGFVGELRRKAGIPLVGQIFTSPSQWSVSDRPFVFHKAGHSSKAAIKSRTFSPIIPLTWTPTPNPADVPVPAFAVRVAHFRPVQLSKNTLRFTLTKTLTPVFKSSGLEEGTKGLHREAWSQKEQGVMGHWDQVLISYVIILKHPKCY